MSCVCSSLIKDLYIFSCLDIGQSSSPQVCHWGLHVVAKPPLSHGRVETGQQFSLEKRQRIMPSCREVLAMVFLGRDWDALLAGANTHFEMKNVHPTIELCSVFSSRSFSGKTPLLCLGPMEILCLAHSQQHRPCLCSCSVFVAFLPAQNAVNSQLATVKCDNGSEAGFPCLLSCFQRLYGDTLSCLCIAVVIIFYFLVVWGSVSHIQAAGV